MKLKFTRAMITAALNGELEKVSFETLPVFNLSIPKECKDVPAEILNPRSTWADKNAYDSTLNKLADQFVKNFTQYEKGTAAEILAAAPKTAVNA
jgi:phosphoenolpyruvate carboxykinase (ATP)